MTDLNIANRWFEEVWNKGRREAIAEMLTPETVIHDGPDSMRGPEGFYPFYDRIQATFTDMHVNVEQTIAQGDMLCVRWTSTMTHNGEGLGFPPTGKACKITGISIVHVEGDTIKEAWQNWDMLGLLEQIQEAPKASTYIAAV